MAINVQDIKQLRELTGCGMMDCKKALQEAEGNVEKAVDILRNKGEKISARRAERNAVFGQVFAAINDSKTEATLLTLNCETDFVAKNQEFSEFGQSVCQKALETQTSNIEDLGALPIANINVEKALLDLISKIGEKIEIGSFQRLEGEAIATYIHSDKTVGVLVALKNIAGAADIDATGKDIAMQIAAMSPGYVDEDRVPQSVIDKEKEIILEKEMSAAKPKPQAIIEQRIVPGAIKKFYEEQTLLKQKFIKDNVKTVQEHLSSIQKGLTVSDFARFAVKR